MRISDKHIKQLQLLLNDQHGLEYTTEQTQEIGIAIMRFVIAKAKRQQELMKGYEYEKENHKATA